jgi:hypothetical protein
MNQDDIICMAREASTTSWCYMPTTLAELERFAALVAAAEREACAKMLETTDLGGMSADPKLQNWTAALLFNYAAAIRARGQHGT